MHNEKLSCHDDACGKGQVSDDVTAKRAATLSVPGTNTAPTRVPPRFQSTLVGQRGEVWSIFFFNERQNQKSSEANKLHK